LEEPSAFKPVEETMQIQIAGCSLPEGHRLAQNVETGVMKAGLHVEIEKLPFSQIPAPDRQKKLPLLYIDGKLISEGIILAVKEVQEILLGGEIKVYKKPKE
jgi:hypothetical protein